MEKALIIGGGSGIGWTIALLLANDNKKVTVVDKKAPNLPVPDNIEYFYADLLTTDFKWLNDFQDIDYLFYSAGFGRVAPFHSLVPKEIENLFKTYKDVVATGFLARCWDFL